MSVDLAYLRSQLAKARRDAEYQRKRAERLERECRELKRKIKALGVET